MSARSPLVDPRSRFSLSLPQRLLTLTAAAGVLACEGPVGPPEVETVPPSAPSVRAEDVGPVEIEVSATLIGLNALGTERTNPAGAIFRRGMEIVAQNTGNVEGVARFIVQREVVTPTGNFSAASLVIFDPATVNLPGSSLDGRSGAFVGRDIALIVPGLNGGIQTTGFTLHGTGGLAGIKLTGTAVGFEFRGTLVVPRSAL